MFLPSSTFNQKSLADYWKEEMIPVHEEKKPYHGSSSAYRNVPFCSRKCGNFKGYPVPSVLKGTEQKQMVKST